MRLSPRGMRTRYERRTDSQRSRARAHHDRIKRSLRRRQEPFRLSAFALRSLTILTFLLSLLLGASLAWPTLEAGSRWWRATPSRVEAIAVVGNQRLAPEEIAQATGVAKGQIFDEVDLEQVEARLVRHPWVRAAWATRLPIDQLLIEIEERQPAALLKLESGDTWQLVDAEGTPFAPADDISASGLPRLLSDRQFESDRAAPQLADAVGIAQEMERLGLAHFSEGGELRLPREDNAEGWVLALPQDSSRVLLGQVEVGQRIQRLAQLVHADLTEVSDAAQIDLRFSGRAILSGTSASH